MIFYFTATGNSLDVAQKLNKEFEGKLVNMADAVRHKEFDYEVNDVEKVIFVFPVYFSGMPHIVGQFIDELKLTGQDKYDIAGVITCGGAISGADQLFRDAIQKIGYSVNGVYEIKMVSNYIIMSDLAPEEEIKKTLEQADLDLIEVIKSIKNGYKDAYVSSQAQREATVKMYAMYENCRDTKDFWVNDNCIGCGLCQTVCPAVAIQLDGKPKWTKEKCEKCLACINRCPVHAIQHGDGTEKRERYINPILKH